MNNINLHAVDLSRDGTGAVIMRLVTNHGNLDVSMRRTHAAAMGSALTEYATAIS